MEEIKHWKTTIIALVVFANSILQQIGLFELTPEQQTAFVSVILFFVALFAGGSTKSTK